MEKESREEELSKKPSYWEVFMDDVHLIFLLGAVVMVLSYTIWGLVELGSVPTHPMVKP